MSPTVGTISDLKAGGNIKANGDYDMSQVRYLYRVMLEGDAPV